MTKPNIIRDQDHYNTTRDFFINYSNRLLNKRHILRKHMGNLNERKSKLNNMLCASSDVKLNEDCELLSIKKSWVYISVSLLI